MHSSKLRLCATLYLGRTALPLSSLLPTAIRKPAGAVSGSGEFLKRNHEDHV